jgi:hypothetical protein
MSTRTFGDRPLPDGVIPDLLDPRSHSDVVAPVVVVESPEKTESDDWLSPARGILVAVLLCTPFWLAVFWLRS